MGVKKSNILVTIPPIFNLKHLDNQYVTSNSNVFIDFKENLCYISIKRLFNNLKKTRRRCAFGICKLEADDDLFKEYQVFFISDSTDSYKISYFLPSNEKNVIIL